MSEAERDVVIPLMMQVCLVFAKMMHRMVVDSVLGKKSGPA